jgi:CDP-diacylglycerol--inositol 3-phosphatidyltransferase
MRRVFSARCYIVSGFLDAVDGHAARYLGQSSKFGGMLDMLTDRWVPHL